MNINVRELCEDERDPFGVALSLYTGDNLERTISIQANKAGLSCPRALFDRDWTSSGIELYLRELPTASDFAGSVAVVGVTQSDVLNLTLILSIARHQLVNFGCEVARFGFD